MGYEEESSNGHETCDGMYVMKEEEEEGLLW
jgi:hypothetical protein